MSSTALDKLRENLGLFLTQTYGSAQADADGDFHADRGPVRVWLRPVQAGEGATVVLMWAASNVGMRLDADLTRFLATESTQLPLTQFELQTAGPAPAVLASYALLGEFLSREEVEVALEQIAETAREYGPTIQERFGGFLPGTPMPQPQQVPDEIPKAPSRPTGPPTRPLPIPKQRGPSRSTLLVRTLFGFLGLAGAIWGGWYAWTQSHSLWIVAYVVMMTMWVVTRGFADVITDRQKVRRAIFFLVPPILSIATVWGTYRLWGLMWLSTILGFFLALPIGIAITRALFPRIALEEDVDTEERKRS